MPGLQIYWVKYPLLNNKKLLYLFCQGVSNLDTKSTLRLFNVFNQSVTEARTKKVILVWFLDIATSKRGRFFFLSSTKITSIQLLTHQLSESSKNYRTIYVALIWASSPTHRIQWIGKKDIAELSRLYLDYISAIRHEQGIISRGYLLNLDNKYFNQHTSQIHILS